MRIAALYDVHGNLPALEAVMARLRRETIDLLVVGGDVFPGPLPVECLELLEAWPGETVFILGNGDADTLVARRGEALERVPESFHAAMHFGAAKLGDAPAERIARWPLVHRVTVPGLGRVLFCHATPRDENELFTRLTPDAVLRSKFEGCDADLVVCGHTHMAFDRMFGELRLVNAGSVGLPFGEPGAHWLSLGPDGIRFHRTDYDQGHATERLAATGFPAPFEIREPPSAERMLAAFESAVH